MFSYIKYLTFRVVDFYYLFLLHKLPLKRPFKPVCKETIYFLSCFGCTVSLRIFRKDSKQPLLTGRKIAQLYPEPLEVLSYITTHFVFS